MRNRVKSATPAVQTYMEDKADEVNLPEEPKQQAQQVQQEHQAQVDADPQEPDNTDDASWLDGLTPYQTAEQQVGQPQQTPQTQPEQTADHGTEDQQARLKQLYDNFEHIDEEVAQELDSKMLAPMRAELNELKAIRQQEQQARQNELLAKANNSIFARYPQAEKILRSQQFMDFVNADNEPYATDKEFDKLMRAYYAGDGDYVLRKLDKFAESRGKPKPPVGVEPQQGSGGNSVGNVQKQRAMTEAEYLAKRQAIKAAPRGTYPPNALKQLAEQYYSTRG